MKYMPEQPTCHLFVYGSLREHGGLHDAYFRGRWSNNLFDYTDTPILDMWYAVADGRMYSAGAYPIVRFDLPGIVVGELYELRMTTEVIECLNMEAHAGYTLVNIPVVCQATANEPATVRQAWAFHAGKDSGYRFNVRIEHGDWLQYEHERRTTHTHT